MTLLVNLFYLRGEMGSSTEEVKRLLLIEYEQVRSKVAIFDGMRFQVKAWAVTSGSAILFLALNAKKPSLGVLGVAAVLMFAYIELVYMARQEVLFRRSDELESIMEALRRDPDCMAGERYVFGIRCAFPGESLWRMFPGLIRRHNQATVLYLGLIMGILLGLVLYNSL
jgi:hypothetical protein